MNICNLDAPVCVVLCIILGIPMLNKTYAWHCSNFMVANLADDRLSSSSIFENRPHLYPKNARLSSSTGWSNDENDLTPWIQADFVNVVKMVAVVTKGLGRLNFNKWVKDYEVRYSNTSSAWIPVRKDPNNILIFAANTDPSTAVRNDFPSVVEARYLRLYPKDCNNFCALRFDVVGCKATTTTSTTTTSTLTAHAPAAADPTTSTTTSHGPMTTDPRTSTTTTTHAYTATDPTTSLTTTHAPATTTHPTTSTTTSHAPMTTDLRTSITTTTHASTATDLKTSTTTTHAPTRITPTTSISTTTSRPTTITMVEEPCPCVCVNKYNYTMTQAELDVRLSDIVQNLTVPKNTTSRYMRSKISAQDSRPEVVYVGSLGIVLLIIVASLIVLPDLFTFSRFLLKCVNHNLIS